MKTIWKYELKHEVETITLPKNALFLDCQIQNGIIILWLMLDKDGEKEDRIFRILGTGWLFSDEKLKYLATVQRGSLVWHIFEELK